MMLSSQKHAIALSLLSLGAILVVATPPAGPMRRLVTAGHFMKLQDTKSPTDYVPFMYRADTGWNFLLRANTTEAAQYFEHRGQQGFNVIQAVATGCGFDGFEPGEYGVQADRNGEFAWLDHDGQRVVDRPANESLTFDVTQPNLRFWTHIDEILDVATARGFYVALWATWGSSFISEGGGGYRIPLFLHPEQGYAYGRFVGRRFGARQNLMFVLGGDIQLPVSPAPQVAVYRAMAEGIAQGVAEGPDGARAAHRPRWNESSDLLWRNQLMTLHPNSGISSSLQFEKDAWLSVNMIQSGWRNQAKIRPLLQSDFVAAGPNGIRPTFMGEGAYERDCYTWCNQPAIEGDPPTTGAWGVRVYAWWGILSGGIGYAYGSEGTWEWRDANAGPVSGIHGACTGFTQYSWREAVYEFPGAASLRHLADLSEDLWGLQPDLDGKLLRGSVGSAQNCTMIIAAKTRFGGLIAYSTMGEAVALSDPPQGTAQWINPRTGARTPAHMKQKARWVQTAPPDNRSGIGHDWALLITP